MVEEIDLVMTQRKIVLPDGACQNPVVVHRYRIRFAGTGSSLFYRSTEDADVVAGDAPKTTIRTHLVYPSLRYSTGGAFKVSGAHAEERSDILVYQ